MDCPTEERLITDKLSGMPGIVALQFNLLQRTLTISHEPGALEPALSAIRELGFKPVTDLTVGPLRWSGRGWLAYLL